MPEHIALFIVRGKQSATVISIEITNNPTTIYPIFQAQICFLSFDLRMSESSILSSYAHFLALNLSVSPSAISFRQ